jgi:hypothetical protein
MWLKSLTVDAAMASGAFVSNGYSCIESEQVNQRDFAICPCPLQRLYPDLLRFFGWHENCSSAFAVDMAPAYRKKD